MASVTMAMLRALILLTIFTTGSVEGDAVAPLVSVDLSLFRNCRVGWRNYGNRCYKYFPDTVKWITAERNCQDLGGNLASSRSQEENDFLLSLVPTSTRCWIGANDAVEDGEWLWSDGSPTDYTNWCAGEPNNYNGPEDCLELTVTSNRCWNDQRCSTKLSYICAKPWNLIRTDSNA